MPDPALSHFDGADTARDQVNYARVARVIARAAPDAGSPEADRQAELLALARQRAMDPGVFDQYVPYFWAAEISSNRWDAYQTRMDPGTTLRNYVVDAQAGVAFLRNHDTERDPFGHSLDAAYVGSSASDAPEGVARVLAEFFTIPTLERASYLADMRAGVVRDVSVGFYGGWWECSICGRDMLQWFTAGGCPHLLGVTYTPTDESGTPRGEPQVARATIIDAHLAEVSAVYDGATPGAMLQKARALATEGALTPRERGLIEVRYRLPGGARLTLPAAPSRFVVPASSTPPLWTADTNGLRFTLPVTTPRQPQQEDRRMDRTPPNGATPDALLSESLLSRALDVVPGSADPGEIVTRLLDAYTTLRQQIDTVTAERDALRPAAELGRQWRAELVEMALVEGVRALGDRFDRDRYARTLANPAVTVEEIRDLTALWSEAAAARFPRGRQTTDRPERSADESAPQPTAPPSKVFAG